MNQFLDLLGTKLCVDISLALEPIVDNGEPYVQVLCNGICLHKNFLSSPLICQISIDLLSPIEISVELSDKQYSATKETAIIIKSVNIDGFEIVPNWTHLAEYFNEKNVTSPTSYLGFNGVWTLKIQEPFYRWKHRITGQGWLLDPTT